MNVMWQIIESNIIISMIVNLVAAMFKCRRLQQCGISSRLVSAIIIVFTFPALEALHLSLRGLKGSWNRDTGTDEYLPLEVMSCVVLVTAIFCYSIRCVNESAKSARGYGHVIGYYISDGIHMLKLENDT